MEVIEIKVSDYMELIAKAMECQAYRDNLDIVTKEEIKDAWKRDYCYRNPDILDFYRENNEESDGNIVEDLCFEDIAKYNIETYCTQEDIVRYSNPNGKMIF